MSTDWLLDPLPHHTPLGFFAFASNPPSIPETIRAAIQGINRTQAAEIRSWEELALGGKLIIRDICSAIDRADFFCADVTTINPNVLFELGYAVAQNKRIWVVRDESYTDSRKEFEQLKVLTTVGYSPYENSEEIIKTFFSHAPHTSPEQTIFKLSIEPLLTPSTPESQTLVYLKSRFDTEASVRMTRVLEDSRLPLTVDDPRETSVRPLTWYGQKLFGAMAVAAHFLSSAREGHRLHNARYAFVSGLACGFGVKSLILTEQDDLLAPMDYRDAIRVYTTPTEAARITTDWVQPLAAQRVSSAGKPKTYVDVVRLATELKDFHLELGEYVAENEAERLNAYFVETTAYSDVVNGTHTIFVGRKGTGKTANLIRAAQKIGNDVQNLVVLIKPPGYEIEGLARLFAEYKQQDQKGYVIESLWKYMLYSEIAHTLSRQMQEEAQWQLSDDAAQDLVALLEEPNSPFSGDFTIRLERAVSALSKFGATAEPIETFRCGISEALHSGALSQLRSKLTEVLGRKHQVLLLIDNLDKPWTKSADLEQLAEFLLGLLGAASRVAEELRQKVKQKRPIRFNSAVFLRSDIFNRLAGVAREPDKLSFTRLKWDDPELLLRIVEERYVASHGAASDPAEMWHRYFCGQVRGVPMRDYLVSRILPRPRDIIFLVKAAVSFAVNRKHDRVEERDVLDGEKQYSQYALDSILVENGISIPELEAVLLEFAASPTIISETAVRKNVSRTGIDTEKVDSVISHLVNLTFLGLEVSAGKFVYSDDPKEIKKDRVLAEHYRHDNVLTEQRYEINAPFRAYLEIADTVDDQ